MNVSLTPRAIELLEVMRAQGKDSAESILEHALEVLVREEGVERRSRETQGRAVSEMLDFVQHNRVRLIAQTQT